MKNLKNYNEFINEDYNIPRHFTLNDGTNTPYLIIHPRWNIYLLYSGLRNMVTFNNDDPFKTTMSNDPIYKEKYSFRKDGSKKPTFELEVNQLVAWADNHKPLIKKGDNEHRVYKLPIYKGSAKDIKYFEVNDIENKLDKSYLIKPFKTAFMLISKVNENSKYHLIMLFETKNELDGWLKSTN